MQLCHAFNLAGQYLANRCVLRTTKINMNGTWKHSFEPCIDLKKQEPNIYTGMHLTGLLPSLINHGYKHLIYHMKIKCIICVKKTIISFNVTYSSLFFLQTFKRSSPITFRNSYQCLSYRCVNAKHSVSLCKQSSRLTLLQKVFLL